VRTSHLFETSFVDDARSRMMTTNGAYVVNQPGVVHVMAPPSPVVHYQGAATTTVMMPNQLVPNGVYVQEPYVGPISMVLGVCLLGFLCPLVFFCPVRVRARREACVAVVVVAIRGAADRMRQ